MPCHNDGCIKRPTYNYNGKTKAIYCNQHKLSNMIDIKSKRCKYEGCMTIPNYNYNGETKAIYCAQHKLPNMINIKSERCKNEGCMKQPTYNFDGQTKALYCAQHKLPNMIDIKSKKCQNEGCMKQPNYNYDGKTKPLYCNQHKLDNMIDIKHKRCIYEGCMIRPTYNYDGEDKALYCAQHKLPNMIDIKSKRCQNSWCYTRATDKYEGYCAYCYMHIFPDKPVSRNYKTKEKTVVDYIKIQFLDIDIITDKKIKDGCSRRRPDVFIDLGYQVIIVEIDENKHNDYDCSCENKRIMELSQDVDHRPIIFIRFNPDDYKSDDKIITSCWNINKNGLCSIKKSKEKEWNERLNNLKNNIEYWLNPNNITNKIIEIIQLYYDQ